MGCNSQATSYPYIRKQVTKFGFFLQELLPLVTGKHLTLPLALHLSQGHPVYLTLCLLRALLKVLVSITSLTSLLNNAYYSFHNRQVFHSGLILPLQYIFLSVYLLLEADCAAKTFHLIIFSV
jgi:hypothetical protein